MMLNNYRLVLHISTVFASRNDLGHCSFAAGRAMCVSPLYEGNVGAIARVAANFSLFDVVVVNPQCDIRGPEAKKMAKGPAREVLGNINDQLILWRALRRSRSFSGSSECRDEF